MQSKDIAGMLIDAYFYEAAPAHSKSRNKIFLFSFLPPYLQQLCQLPLAILVSSFCTAVVCLTKVGKSNLEDFI
jgi:hypothetical protein